MKQWQYFVHSSDGTDYKVGVWRDGIYHPGTHQAALRELRLLGEPGSYVWGRLLRD